MKSNDVIYEEKTAKHMQYGPKYEILNTKWT